MLDPEGAKSRYCISLSWSMVNNLASCLSSPFFVTAAGNPIGHKSWSCVGQNKACKEGAGIPTYSSDRLCVSKGIQAAASVNDFEALLIFCNRYIGFVETFELTLS